MSNCLRPIARTAFICSLVAAAALTLAPAPAVAQVDAYAFVPNFGDHTVSIIDTRTATVTSSVTLQSWSYGFAAVVTPDGRYAYVADAGGAVWRIDVVTHTLLRVGLVGGIEKPIALAITHDGRKLYVVDSYNNRVDVVDTTTNATSLSLDVGSYPYSVTLSPDGQRAWVTNYIGSTISVIDTTTDTLVGSPISTGTNMGPDAMAFTPDGTRAYVSNFGPYGPGNLALIDVASGSVLSTIPTPKPTGIQVTPDGSHVLVGDNMSAVQVLDTTTNTFGTAIPVGNKPLYIALTPDGTSAYVTNLNSDTVSVIDLASLTVVHTIAVGNQPEGFNAFIGPNIITTNCSGCGPLSIGSDAALTPIPFGQFVPFNNGILSLQGAWTTTRTLSLLAGGGTLRLNGFNSQLQGDIIGEGALTLEGSGWVTFTGTATHAGGTIVPGPAGVLTVNGSHTAPVHLQGGRLTGHGTIGTLDATGGIIQPGDGSPGILHVGTATLGPNVVFGPQINGTAAGTDYAQLAAASVALNDAYLGTSFSYIPHRGDAFTLATHVTGTFRSLPEGSFLRVAGVSLRITYHGGSSGSDAVIIADGPPSVSGLTDQTITAGSTLGPIACTVGDDVTQAAALTLSATSSNHALLPDVDILFGGSGTARTLTATPVPGVSGTTTITVTVSDGWQTAQQTFTLTVIDQPVYYLAEGATGGFFSTDLLLANPQAVAAPVVITFYKDDGSTVVQNLTLPATSRTTLQVNQITGMAAAAFSTSVTSTNGLPLVVERTMWWDASGYGSSTEKASAAAASQWYFAEGSQGYFHTYFLLLNPHAVPTVAHATYFLEDGSTVQRDYTVPATARLTMDAGSEPALLNQSFGAVFAFDLPGMAERAMYFGDAPRFTGGHAAAGATAPSTTWYLAEGATGSFFDTFVLVANPNAAPATVTLTYLPDNGVPIVKTHALAGHQRLTINIADEDPALASAAVSTRVEADQPVVAERSQYWPHAAWYEAHNSGGETTPGTKWGLAEGRVGGSTNAQTYILIANPGAQAAAITATFLRSDGTTLVKSFIVGPTSRFNIAVTGAASSVPELADESFATVIESTQPVIVERSCYTDANGVTWAAGTNATATRLP
jgi:YVTN family beta-propeller protein